MRDGLAGLVLVGIIALSPVQPVAAQNLNESLAAAYLNNPTLLAKRAELRSLDETVPQALSGWRPTVTASGSLTQNYFRSQSAGFGMVPPFTTQGDNFEKRVGVAVEQPLFSGFRTVNGMKRAENSVRAGRADLVATEQQVLLDGVTAYMDVLRDQAVLELNINNEQVLRRQLEATQDRFEVGELTRTDVAQSESRLARALADRVQSEGDLEVARSTFTKVIGAPPQNLQPPPPVSNLPSSVEDATSRAASVNPQVVAALYQERAAANNADAVEGELLPSINLIGQYSLSFDPSVTTTEQEVGTIGAEISIPIYQAGNVSARTREAKQVVSQRRLEIVEAKRDAIEFATQAWERFVAAQASVKAFEEEARSAQIALEGVREEERAGLRTVLDVLDAEQEFLDARVSLVRARRDEVVASYALLAAAGGLTAAALGLDVPLYDPEAYYNQVRNKIWGLGEDPIPMPAE